MIKFVQDLNSPMPSSNSSPLSKSSLLLSSEPFKSSPTSQIPSSYTESLISENDDFFCEDEDENFEALMMDAWNSTNTF